MDDEDQVVRFSGEMLVVNRGAGWGFELGAAVIIDPEVAITPVWGHNWFVDPARKFLVVVLTNTAMEGMMGRLPLEIRNAVCDNL